MKDIALLELAFDLAARAGETILAVRARGFDTQIKADASPVTEADQQAELLIVGGCAPPRRTCRWSPRRRSRPATCRSRPTVSGASIRSTAPASSPPGATISPSASAWCARARRCWAWWARRPGAWSMAASSGSGAVKRSAAGEQPIVARRPPAEGIAVVASRHPRQGPAHGAVPGALAGGLDGEYRLGAEILPARRGAGGSVSAFRHHHGVGHLRGRRRCWRRPAGRCGWSRATRCCATASRAG